MSIRHIGPRREDKKSRKERRVRALWIAILICFLLMGGPLIILLDHSNVRIHEVPILYVFVFILWIVLCILTFIGYLLRWGENEDEEDLP